MPTYEFQCECGLLFERSVPLAKRGLPVKCRCGEQAARAMPEEVAGVFKQAVQGGPVPQNTGVASFDAHVDRVIGTSAEDGWAFQESRDSVKRRVLQQHPNAKSSDLSSTPDGEWEIMPERVKQRTYRARLINHQALSGGHYVKDDSGQ